MNVEIGAEAAQFPEKEYINGIAVVVCVSAMMRVNLPCATEITNARQPPPPAAGDDGMVRKISE
jgi:hypothetical protein